MNAIAQIQNNTTELTLAQRNSWIRFHRFPGNQNFWGVVNKEGEWVDSSVTMNGAIWAAAMDAGIPNMDVEISQMNVHIQEKGYSIVHNKILEMMFHAGILK